LTSDPPPSDTSRLSTRDECRVLPRFLTEITPHESVSQISSSEDSIPSDQVSLISKAEKGVLQWKAQRLDAITRELRAIQIGSKAGLSTATIRDILGGTPTQSTTSSQTEVTVTEDARSLLMIATSTAIPAILCIALVTLTLRSSTIPSLRHVHRFLTRPSTAPTSATIIYRAAKPAGLSPHNLTFLVPFLVVGSAVVGWNVLTKELGLEFGEMWGKHSLLGQLIHGVEEWDVDWESVGEFFGMVEATMF